MSELSPTTKAAGAVTATITGTPDVNIASPDPLPVQDEWRITSQSDETTNNSDKSFTVPASTEWQLLGVYVEFISTGTAGNRQLAIEVQDGAADVIAQLARAGVVQAASLTRYYQFGIGMSDLAAFRDTDLLTTPLPSLLLAAGMVLRVWDNKAVDAAADDMQVHIIYAARSV